jgi:hypothetical protein
VNTLSGGRTWWAHFKFTRINIAPTILRKKIEDWRDLRRFWHEHVDQRGEKCLVFEGSEVSA